MPRTLSAAAHQKAIDAALKLVAKHGVDGTSMDAIAAVSGVSKATIYKHWSDKEQLMLDVMTSLVYVKDRPSFNSGNTRADMTAVLAFRPKQNQKVRERLLPHFVAYSARNQEFGNAWRARAMEPPRRELSRLIEEGVDKGELQAGLDMEICLALLLGPVLYNHIFLKQMNLDSQKLAEAAVGAFWRAFAR